MGVSFKVCPSCDEIFTDCAQYSCDACETYYCDTCMSGNNVGCRVCSLEVVPTLTILSYMVDSTWSRELWEQMYRVSKMDQDGLGSEEMRAKLERLKELEAKREIH